MTDLTEREQIVAWLRKGIREVDADNRYWGGPHRRQYASAPEILAAIERGEHLGEQA